MSSEQSLDRLQRAAFGYFLHAVNPANGLIADNSRENSPTNPPNPLPGREQVVEVILWAFLKVSTLPVCALPYRLQQSLRLKYL